MNSTLKKTSVALAGLILSALWVPTELAAQSRSALSLKNPGTLSTLGQGTSGNTFRDYSYGLGSLENSSVSTAGNILRGNINRNTTLSGRNSGDDTARLMGGAKTPAGGKLGVRPRRTRRKRHSPSFRSLVRTLGPRAGIRMKDTRTSGIMLSPIPNTGTALLLRDISPLGIAQEYLDVINTESPALTEQTQPITSLVPKLKNKYRNHIETGDKAFRAGDFEGAFRQFRLAGYIAPNAPENLLNLMHARFALSRFSYASASLYLRTALKNLPELPLANLQPKGFYGNPGVYVHHLDRLAIYLKQNPYDVDANLMAAYFYWFNAQIPDAQDALSKALTTATETDNDDMLEAIDTFWTSMVASGKVSGKLMPKPRPKKVLPITQPTESATTTLTTSQEQD